MGDKIEVSGNGRKVMDLTLAVQKHDVKIEELEEKLGKDADAGDYIDDFKKSDAPQFKGKSDKKKRDMAIAAYLDAKDKKEEVELDEKEMRVFRVSSSKLQGNVHAKDEKEAEKIFRKKVQKERLPLLIEAQFQNGLDVM